MDWEGFSPLSRIEIRRRACSNPDCWGFPAREFLFSLVLGWDPKPCVPTNPRVMLLPPVWGPHCEDHGLRGWNPTPEGSRLWGRFWGVSQTRESYPSPLSTSSPLTKPPSPPPGCLSQQGLQIERRKVGGEPSYTDLIARQLNHGSLARNPLKVLCAGWLQGPAPERGCAATSCSLTGRGRDKL